MKRRITELEQKLINDGWILTSKSYTGRHSEKIESYDYTRVFNDALSFIKLTPNRKNIIDFGFSNGITIITSVTLGKITAKLRELFNYVESIDNPPEKEQQEWFLHF